MSPVNHEPTGPFVGAAFLCEQIIRDESGVVSVIRIIDRITTSATGPEAPQQMPRFQWSTKALVQLKDGDARGRHVLTFRMEEPSGIRQEMAQRTVHFTGGGHGTNMVLDLTLGLSQEGLHWIDVLLGDNLLTRIPLEVVYEFTQTTGPTPQPG